MSKGKLTGIIVGFTIAIIMAIVINRPPPTATTTYTLSVGVSPSGAGSVSPSGGEYSPGAQVTLTASPASGYIFDYWSGSALGTTSTITITMDSDKSLTANFETIPTASHDLTISVNGQGTTNPSVGTYKYDNGTQVTITASPASGWKFDHWSGDASGTSPTIVITTDSNKDITAYFEEESQTSRTNPAGLYQPVRVEVDNWRDGKVVLELEMLELISGHTAWNMIYAWNMFNDEPEAGKEYILAKFRIKIVELEKQPYDTSNAQFDVYSATGVMYTDWVSVAGMNPNLRTSLYEGAEHIGYTAFLVRTDDSPVAVYMARWDENAIWFDLRAGS